MRAAGCLSAQAAGRLPNPAMYLRLDEGLVVYLQCDHPVAQEKWRLSFDGRLSDAAPLLNPPPLAIHFEINPELPALPEAAPYFVDERPAFADTFGAVSAYAAGKGRILLHFLRGALVRIEMDTPPLRARGLLTERMLRSGRFEDVTLTSLAPLLRRRGYYLLHAFAAVRAGEAVLIVGASGSGKTTTGLSLLLNGWHLLSNDAVLLRERQGQVYALPTPGCVTIRPQTFELLPALRQLVGHDSPLPRRAMAFTAAKIAGGRWAEPTPVRRIYFSRIEPGETSAVTPLRRAVGLAYLMEESVDTWDRQALAGHVALLRRLTQQASTRRLRLGPDVAALPALLQT